MRKMLIGFITTVLTLFFVSACEPIPYYWGETWNAMIDIDGSTLNFICQSRGYPFFIQDPDNEENEILLLDTGNSIARMNQDGTDYRAVIDSVGGIFRFSDDRSKILMNYDDDIYFANTDGSQLMNLTNTPDFIENDPDFSPDCSKVIYEYWNVPDSLAVIECYDFELNSKYIIYQETYADCTHTSQSPKFILFYSPVFIDENNIAFGKNYISMNGSDGLYFYNILEDSITLIDSGSVHDKITFQENSGILAYKKLSTICFYYPDSGEIVELEDFNFYYQQPVFNRDGSLMALNAYIFDTQNLDYYYLLEYYDSYAYCINSSLDFNFNSSKTVMAVDRRYPQSEGFE